MFRPKFWKNNSQSAPEKSAVPIIIIKTSRFDRKYFQKGFQSRGYFNFFNFQEYWTLSYSYIYSTATNNRYVIKFLSQNVNIFFVYYFQLFLCLWDMRLGCGCIYFFIIQTRRQDILLVLFFQIHLGESKFNLDRSLSF